MKETIERTAFMMLCTAALAACSNGANNAVDSTTVVAKAPVAAAKPSLVPFRVPSESEIKDSVTLASVRRGRALIHSTRDSLPANARSSLNCANCHFVDGTQADAMPLVGAYARFPQYRARSGKVDLLEDRINDCFVRSLNGKALSPASREMQGQGVPALDPLKGDTASGRAVFAANCVACHGPDGQGTKLAPPLWGPKSFNIGAGMARVNTAARFIHKLMPRDRPGILTPQQAYDVASFVTSRPRPDFAGKENDWPKGGAPPDVAYPTRGKKPSAK